MCDLLLWSVVGHRLWQLAFWFEDEKHLWLLVIWSELHGHPMCIIIHHNTSMVNRDIIASENLTRYLCVSPQSHIVTVDTYIFFQLPSRSVEITHCDLLTVDGLQITMQVVTWCQFQLAPYLVIGSPIVAVIGVVGMVNCFKWKFGRTLPGCRLCDLNQGKWSH